MSGFPQPNAHGVYDDACALRFEAEGPRHRLIYRLLRIEAGWIVGHDYQAAGGFRSLRPLRVFRDSVYYPGERDALYRGLADLSRELDGSAAALPRRIVAQIHAAYVRHAQLDLFDPA